MIDTPYDKMFLFLHLDTFSPYGTLIPRRFQRVMHGDGFAGGASVHAGGQNLFEQGV